MHCFTPRIIWKLLSWMWLFQKNMLYEFELDNKAPEAIKNICTVINEGTIDQSTVNGWFKKFCPTCKNLDDQARLVNPKTIDIKTILQAIETNPGNCSQRVSSEFGNSHFRGVYHLSDIGKSSQSCWNASHETKIKQDFWLTLVFKVSKSFHWPL